MKHKDIYAEIDRYGLPEVLGFPPVAYGIAAALLYGVAWVIIIVW